MIDKNLIPILDQVFDPEIPVLTVMDMGIVQKAYFDENNKIVVAITPTYTGCPAMDMINVNLKAVFQENGYEDIEVKIVLNPAWSTDMITEEGKQKMKEYGIAPPIEKSSDKSFLDFKEKVIPCPRCESTNTRMISHFGSTACKAMYACNDCLEPFDYFKCH